MSVCVSVCALMHARMPARMSVCVPYAVLCLSECARAFPYAFPYAVLCISECGRAPQGEIEVMRLLRHSNIVRYWGTARTSEEVRPLQRVRHAPPRCV